MLGQVLSLPKSVRGSILLSRPPRPPPRYLRTVLAPHPCCPSPWLRLARTPVPWRRLRLLGARRAAVLPVFGVGPVSRHRSADESVSLVWDQRQLCFSWARPREARPPPPASSGSTPHRPRALGGERETRLCSAHADRPCSQPGPLAAHTLPCSAGASAQGLPGRERTGWRRPTGLQRGACGDLWKPRRPETSLWPHCPPHQRSRVSCGASPANRALPSLSAQPRGKVVSGQQDKG